MTASRILVLGGGISGLLAAWHLRRRGHEVEVWEAGPTVGGWAQTLPWPGPQGEPGWLERGPQGLRLVPGGALARLLEDLDLRPLPASRKGPRWLGKAGERHPGHGTLAGLLHTPGMSLGDKLRMLAEPLIPRGTDPDETLHAFFTRRLGPGFARELLPALVGGVLAAPPERIGLEALPRLRQLEARGGLLLGGLRLGSERTCLLPGGMGALAQALAARPDRVRTGTSVHSLEALPGGRWRAVSEGTVAEAEAVVVALPPRQAADLLAAIAPEASRLLEAPPRLDLRVWHSRHALAPSGVPGWERGFGLLIHPPEGRGLLGAVALADDDPRGVPGLLQVRTYLGGAYPVAPDLETWQGVFRELRRWLPELPEAIQVREESCPGAFPLLEPGHGARVARLVAALPSRLHWVGAARFGPGLPELAEGIGAWAASLRT